MTIFQEQDKEQCADCGQEFVALSGLIYCSQCREKKEYPEGYQAPPLEDDSFRWFWDYRIIDERGDEVWAKDLAERYRKELLRRQQRDYRERK